MKHALSLGKVFGVKLYIHWTFPLLIVWIIISEALAGSSMNDILWKMILILTLFICVILHELGHAFAAKRYNVATKYITLLPIGGLAQIERMPEDPRQELVIAVAGPLVNIIIALLLFPFIDIKSVLFQPDTLAPPGPSNFLFYLGTLNVWLAIFNMVPAFPMDGGRVLRALLTFRLGRTMATKIASGIGYIFGIGFFIIGLLFNPILMLIGIFIFFSGQYESTVVQTSEFLHKYTVSDVIMREIPRIESKSTITEAAKVLLATQDKNFVVTDDGKPVGTIRREQIVTAFQERGGNTLIEDVTDKNLYYVSDAMPLDETWKIMQNNKTPLILVGTAHKVSGVVDMDNIAEFILLQPKAK